MAAAGGGAAGGAALTLLLLSACADPQVDELEGYIAEVKDRPPGPLEPIPEIPPVETFVYQPNGRRDPFIMDKRSARKAEPQEAGGIAPDPLRRKEVLEGYSLDSLRMVGTLEQYSTRWALVSSPDGVLHRVRVGNYMGRHNGQIVRIEPTEIALIEIVDDGRGGWREREASLALKN